MTLVALPDFVAMLILMGILARLMGRHPGQRVELWLIGLALILVETVSALLYGMWPVWTRELHAISLDAYVLAAMTFSLAARGNAWTRHVRFPLFVLPAAPLLMLCTLYGLAPTGRVPYLWITGVTFVLGVGQVAWSWKPRLRIMVSLLALHGWMWLPMVILSWYGRFQGAVSWGLCCQFLLAAFAFRRYLHRARIGGIAIVAGFVIWAACFGLQPLVRGNSVYGPVLDQTWKMQKFFVTIGMLLVLLEDQTRRSEEQALHDVLTGLPNRRLFDDRLVHALERSRRFGTSLGLFVIDLNGFKEINDSCGHSAGDDALQQTAAHLKSRVRGSDTVARLGGDEFCVIMADVAGGDCGRIAQVLRDAVSRVGLPPHCPSQLSGSVGYALYPQDAVTADELRNLADARMYEEKRAIAAASTRYGTRFRASELSS